MRVCLEVNGASAQLDVEPRRTLLDVLRHELQLTGAKRACDMGDCGTCTVLLDARPVYACLALAVDCDGRVVNTIEGLAPEGVLHPIQQAFIDADALQCGFCTPGQVLSAKALLDVNPDPSEHDIVRALSGNLCRCGAYPNIVRAVKLAARRLAPSARQP